MAYLVDGLNLLHSHHRAVIFVYSSRISRQTYTNQIIKPIANRNRNYVYYIYIIYMSGWQDLAIYLCGCCTKQDVRALQIHLLHQQNAKQL